MEKIAVQNSRTGAHAIMWKDRESTTGGCYLLGYNAMAMADNYAGCMQYSALDNIKPIAVFKITSYKGSPC
jgi:hypothetical protein